MSCIYYQSKRALEESIFNINHIDATRAELRQGSSDLPEPVLEAVALARRAVWAALDTLIAVNPILPPAPPPGFLLKCRMPPCVRDKLTKLKHVEKGRAILAAIAKSEIGGGLLQIDRMSAHLQNEKIKIMRFEDPRILLAVGSPEYLQILRVHSWEPQASEWLAVGPVDLVRPEPVKDANDEPLQVVVNPAQTSATKQR